MLEGACQISASALTAAPSSGNRTHQKPVVKKKALPKVTTFSLTLVVTFGYSVRCSKEYLRPF
jgi:hypothetical protein